MKVLAAITDISSACSFRRTPHTENVARNTIKAQSFHLNLAINQSQTNTRMRQSGHI